MRRTIPALTQKPRRAARHSARASPRRVAHDPAKIRLRKQRFSAIARPVAALAQLVEHLIRNEGVVGSNPTSGTTPLSSMFADIQSIGTSAGFFRAFVRLPSPMFVGNRRLCWYERWYQQHTSARPYQHAFDDLAIRHAKPGASVRKLSDGGGLQLWIMPNGSKLWRLAYRIEGKQRLNALGAYPEVSLQARGNGVTRQRASC